MESYEAKGKFPSHSFKVKNENSLNQVLEEERNNGLDDEEEALEHIARFNEDMSLIALNVF